MPLSTVEVIRLLRGYVSGAYGIDKRVLSNAADELERLASAEERNRTVLKKIAEADFDDEDRSMMSDDGASTSQLVARKALGPEAGQRP
jgi:hypothetical protein